jgi:O-antigen/teichoic acid export membrane protein
LSVARHLLNTALKVLLVTRGWGVSGVLWSDLLATGAFSLALLPIAAGRVAPALSWPLLRQSLGFGLPKVPHGLLVQVLNLADRKILDLFVTRAEVGLYQVGYTFGTTVKFALSAFEPAWQPFVYSEAEKPDGRATLSRVVSYAFAGFLAAGLGVAVVGPELLVLMTPPAFHPAAAVVPVVALAYVLHGVFLLTSIGIGIAREARYYPLVTAVAAAVNVGANLALVPRMGAMGSAWATVAAYAAMAMLGLWFSQRVHPLPLEGGRLLRLAAAAAITYAVCGLAPGPAVRVALLAVFPLLVVASRALARDKGGRRGGG